MVTDVLVNAPDSVWVERSGVLARTSVHFPDEASVRRLAQRLAAQAGRRLDDAAPCVDAVLPGGTRLHAVLPPVAVRGTLISLRVPPRRAFSLEQLTGSGMLTPLGARLLVALAESRASFLISGGTGTGKTTLLGTLLGLVARHERIVVAEECAELVSTHPHIARLQCRSANQEGAGGVGLRTLVRQALRMRPDRVVVGEVRGVEVCDLLTAMNTGHEGGCATLHANGLAEIPARVEALAAPAGLSRGSIHAQLGAAVHVVLQLVRESGGRRRLASVGVLNRGPEGWVEVVPAVLFEADGSTRPGPGTARLERLLGTVLFAPPEPPTPNAPEAVDGCWSAALAEADRLLPVVNGIELPPPEPEPGGPSDEPEIEAHPADEGDTDQRPEPAATLAGAAAADGRLPMGVSARVAAAGLGAAGMAAAGFGSAGVAPGSLGFAGSAPVSLSSKGIPSVGPGFPGLGSAGSAPISLSSRVIPSVSPGFTDTGSPSVSEPFVADYGPRPATRFRQGGAA
jgi:pilus assembly protein CpaF